MSRYLPPRSSAVRAVNAIGGLFGAAGVKAGRLDSGWLQARAARNAGLDLEAERGRFDAYQKRYDIPCELSA